jgi:predicted kinase
MVMVNTSLEVAQQRNQERDRILPPKLLKKSWEDVQQNLGSFQSLFKNNFVIVDNSKHLSDEEAEAKFVPLVTKVVRKFVGQPIKNKLGKLWVGKQKLLRRK